VSGDQLASSFYVVVKGVDLKASDEVILTSHNHPSNLDSWKVRARRDGFTVTVPPCCQAAPYCSSGSCDPRKGMPRTDRFIQSALSAILILFVGASCATMGARLVPSSPVPNRIQTAARLVYVPSS
jgi:hypothetical protein